MTNHDLKSSKYSTHLFAHKLRMIRATESIKLDLQDSIMILYFVFILTALLGENYDSPAICVILALCYFEEKKLH